MVSSDNGATPQDERRGNMNYEVRQSNAEGAFVIAYDGTRPVYLHHYHDMNCEKDGFASDIEALRDGGETGDWDGNELVYHSLDEVYAMTKPIDVDGELIPENMGVDAKIAYGVEQ